MKGLSLFVFVTKLFLLLYYKHNTDYMKYEAGENRGVEDCIFEVLQSSFFYRGQIGFFMQQKMKLGRRKVSEYL